MNVTGVYSLPFSAVCATYPEIHTKHINVVCGQNAEAKIRRYIYIPPCSNVSRRRGGLMNVTGVYSLPFSAVCATTECPPVTADKLQCYVACSCRRRLETVKRRYGFAEA